ncbi:MAG: hypothetical protein QXK34_03570 [Candidatus Bathyarchaeia archaeon]
MPVLRADVYLMAKMKAFELDSTSKKLFGILKELPDIGDLKMSKAVKEVEEGGRIRIKEWYNMSGRIKVPEGSRAFWAFVKRSDEDEPWNVMMRLDRNVTAETHEEAMAKAKEWAEETIVEALRKNFDIETVTVAPSEELSAVKAKVVR